MKPEPPPQPASTSDVDEPSAISPGELRALIKDLAVQKDLRLRAVADLENFKRRSRQEIESRIAAQTETFITDLLPVIDSLERALTAGSSSFSAAFHQGVEITLNQLQQLLRKHGVESAEIVGQPFDPHRHEALAQGHDPTLPDHAILKVLRRGYWRGGRVIRPANVVVNDLGLVGRA